MSDIEKLQQRVVEAEERFGLIAEQRAKYSERLMDLIAAIETRLTDQQAEIERQAGEVASQGEELERRRKDSAENKLLRGMLQSLLSAIEAGSRDTLSETMQAMDVKVSALLAGDAAPAAPEEAPALDAPEAETLEAAPEEAPVLDAPEAETLETEAEEAETGTLDEDPEVMASPPLAEVPEQPEAAMPEPETCGADDPSDQSVGPAEEENLASEIELPDPLEEPGAPDGALDRDPVQELPVALDGPEGDAETPVEPETLAAPEPEIVAAGDVEPGDIESGDAEAAMLGEDPAAGAPDDDMAETLASDLPETLEAAEPPEVPPEALAEPAAGSGLENLIDEDAAVPGVATAGDAGDERPDATSLEDIMRRVSKLVEEEGALGPLATGSVRIEAEAEARESETPEPAPVQKAASNS